MQKLPEERRHPSDSNNNSLSEFKTFTPQSKSMESSLLLQPSTRTNSSSKIPPVDKQKKNKLDELIEVLGLDNITLEKLATPSFVRSFQDALDATLSGNVIYLRIMRRVFEKITDPSITTALFNKFEGSFSEQITLKLIVAIKDSSIDSITSALFFKKFLDIFMKLDPFSQTIINKILGIKLIKFRQIVARAFIENNGVLTEELVEELVKTAITFPEAAGLETHIGSAMMTPTGIRRVCQILLPLCTLMVGETNGPKIEHEVTFDDGSKIKILLSVEAIALAYSIINQVNLASAIEKSQDDCKAETDSFKGTLSQFMERIAPYYFDNTELKKDLVLASLNLNLISSQFETQHQSLKSKLKDPEADKIIDSIKPSKSDFAAMILSDFNQTIAENITQETDLREEYTKPLLQSLIQYLETIFVNNTQLNKRIDIIFYKLEKLFISVLYVKDEELQHILANRAVYHKTQKENLLTILREDCVKFVTGKKNNNSENNNTQAAEKSESQVEGLPSELVNQMIEKLQLKIDCILTEKELLLHINTVFIKVSEDNIESKLAIIFDKFKSLAKFINTEQSRIVIGEDKSFQLILQEIAKFDRTLQDTKKIKGILKSKQYTQLITIHNKKFGQLLYDATLKLSKNEISLIYTALKEMKAEILDKLEDPVLAKNLINAMTSGYTEITKKDIVSILKCFADRDFGPLLKIDNEQLGNALHQFLTQDLHLKEHLQLSKKLSFLANMGSFFLSAAPNKFIIWLLKYLIQDKPKPNLQDIPTIGKGLAIQSTSNLGNTLSQGFIDLFKKIPSLDHAFNNTHIRLFNALEHFFHKPKYWLFIIHHFNLKKENLLNSAKLGTKEDKNTIRKIHKIDDTLTDFLKDWRRFERSIHNLLRSSDFLLTFKTEWEKDSFRESWQTLLKNYYNGKNSFLFLMRFTEKAQIKLSKSSLLYPIVIECDKVIRTGLMKSTEAAIQNMGKSAQERPTIEIPKTKNMTELFEQRVLRLGVNEKFPDSSGVMRFYSELLEKTFLNMSCSGEIDKESEFGQFVLSQISRAGLSTQDGSDKTLNAKPAIKWNKACYHRLIKALTEAETSHTAKQKLSMGLPLAVNAGNDNDAKILIKNFILNYKGPVIPEIKEIFRPLESELSIDEQKWRRVIKRNQIDEIERLLKVAGPFDFSIITARQEEGLIIKAYKRGEAKLVSILVRHCVDKNQSLPLLELFSQFPLLARQPAIDSDILKAFAAFEFVKSYTIAIKSLLSDSTLSLKKASHHLLPLSIESGNRKFVNAALHKTISLLEKWPQIKEITKAFEHAFKKNPVDEALFKAAIKSSYKDSLVTELQKLYAFAISHFTAFGNNPLVYAFEHNHKAEFIILLNHCIAMEESYPLLDFLVKYGSNILKDADLRNVFSEKIGKIGLTSALQNPNILDNFFTRELTPTEKFSTATSLMAFSGNCAMMSQVSHSFLKNNYNLDIGLTLSQFYKDLPIDHKIKDVLLKAIEAEDFDEVQLILSTVTKIELSILAAHKINILEIAHTNNDQIFKYVLDYCVETSQILPIWELIQLPNITTDGVTKNALTKAMITLGFDYNNVNLDEKTNREIIFINWYSNTTSLTPQTLEIFAKTPDELFTLCKSKYDLITTAQSFGKLFNFIKKLEKCVEKKSALAINTLVKLKDHCVANPHPLSAAAKESLPDLLKFLGLTYDQVIENIILNENYLKYFQILIIAFEEEQIIIFLKSLLSDYINPKCDEIKKSVFNNIFTQLQLLAAKGNESAVLAFNELQKHITTDPKFNNFKKLIEIFSEDSLNQVKLFLETKKSSYNSPLRFSLAKEQKSTVSSMEVNSAEENNTFKITQ